MVIANARNIPNARSAPSPAIDYDDDLAEFAALVRPTSSSVIDKKSKAQRKKKDPRGFRGQFTFWLCEAKREQLDMGRWLHSLKAQRQFAPTVRNAIALYRDLKEGRVDLLLELFPGIVAKLAPPPPQSTADISRLQGEVDFLKALVLAQQGGAGQGPKPLTVAPPADDDDEDTLLVTVDKDAGARSCNNFIASAFALQNTGAKH